MEDRGEQGSDRDQPKNTEKTLTEAPLNNILSDAGKYSYARLCSSVLCSLYSAKHERIWIKTVLCDLVKHLGLSEKAQTSLIGRMLCDLDTYIQSYNSKFPDDSDAVIRTLKDECQHQQKLVVIPKDMISFALKADKYDARHRVLVYSLAGRLGVAADNVADVEDELVTDLTAKKSQKESEEDERRKEDEAARKFRRSVLIGLGALGGGALIGITGGLAAPFIAAGAGTLLGGGAAVALASIKGLAIITSLFGAAGAGLTGYKMNRKLGEIEQFEFEKLTEGKHLNLALAISGWLKDDGNLFKESGFKDPWRTVKLAREQYCLKWESKYLVELGTALSSLVSVGAVTFATEEANKQTVLQGIMSTVSWPVALLQLGYVIDNPWSICTGRAAEVGKHLAEVLMEKQQGHRPVSLIGFSLGALVIFHCLKTLGQIQGSEGIVQEAILLGAPVTADEAEWKCFEKTVAGRVVNGYCKNDWLLRFACRTASAKMQVAGLQPVKWRNRRMINVNLTKLVGGHMEYAKSEVMDQIFDAIAVAETNSTDDSDGDDDDDDDIADDEDQATSSLGSLAEGDSGLHSLQSEAETALDDTSKTSPSDEQEESVRISMEALHERVARAMAEVPLQYGTSELGEKRWEAVLESTLGESRFSIKDDDEAAKYLNPRRDVNLKGRAANEVGPQSVTENWYGAMTTTNSSGEDVVKSKGCSLEEAGVADLAQTNFARGVRDAAGDPSVQEEVINEESMMTAEDGSQLQMNKFASTVDPSKTAEKETPGSAVVVVGGITKNRDDVQI